jgi:surface protein
MKRIILQFVLFVFGVIYVNGQCPPSGIVLTTQAQIDAFPTNYPGCTHISGFLQIGSSTTITNLTGLSQLTSVGGNLSVINNTNLSNISGLSNITSVGGNFIISNNPNVTSLSPLGNIQSINGNLTVQYSANLATLNGLEGVTAINGYIYIFNNATLSNISGIQNIDPSTINSTDVFKSDIGIYSNAQLSQCEVQTVCDVLALPGSTTGFASNLTGCNSPAEVSAACAQPCNPALTTPMNGAILDNGCTPPYQSTNSSDWFFDWTICPEATLYHLYVKHPTASNPLFEDSTLTTSQYNLILTDSYTSSIVGWEVKVRAFIDGAWSDWSPVITFDVEPPGTDCPPVCNSALTDPANGATNVPVNSTFSWNASGNTTGYIVRAGTTPGGVDIVNNVNVGNVTTYDPPGDLPLNTTIYVSIIPYNANGNATGCAERSFTTAAPSCGDLVVESIVFNYMVSSTINMTYTIKNTGSTTIPASGGILLTFYKSSDNVLQIGTDPVVINFTPMTTTSLAPNQTISGTFNMALDTIAFPYVIAFIEAYSIYTECNENNNVLIQRARGGCTTPGSHNYDPTATIPTVTCLNCSDGIMNGDETGLDCGGTLCIPCTSCLSGGITFTTQSQIDSFPILYPGCVVIDGDMTINSMSAINNFINLQQLTAVGGHVNIGGAGFPFLNGLQNLTEIGGSLSIHDTYLVSITALLQLESLGGSLILYSNPNLSSLNGLNNLDSIGGTLHIVNNQSLNSVSDLTGLQQIDGELHFSLNHQTTTLSGLENIDPNGITNLEIIFNSNLSYCETPNICTYLSNPNNPFAIYNNPNNCASGAAILAVCSPGAPLCTSLTSPANGATNVSVTSALTWATSAGATGYKLTVGTTSGGTDILNNFDVGNVTTFDPAGDFPINTTVYVRIVPYNANDDATGCLEESFSTNIQNVHFITTWKTDNPGSSNATSITIPTTGSGYNYNVDWNNDGVFDQFGITGNVTHDFGVAGTYTIRINGDFPRIYFNNTGDRLKILSVNQWGNISWTSMSYAFAGASNLNINASDTPNLALVTDMSYMFSNATVFNADIGGWDVSNVTDMHFLFYLASSFNQDIGGWDVSNVTDMSGMFLQAFAFNTDIGGWDVSNVTNMGFMFDSAFSFNQDISGWDVSNVINMSVMFQSANSFNQDIGGWNVSNVDNMSYMFQSAGSFNQDIGEWDVSNVSNMFRLFYFANQFNQNIGTWNISNVTNLSSLLDNSGLSITNYDNTLIAWDLAGYTNKNIGVNLLKYCNSATARNNMITNKGWTFNGDALDCSAFPVCTSLTSPLNNATNVSLTSALTWAASSGATGYKLTVGTTPGGTDILNNFDVGNVVTYNPAGDFPAGTIIYVKITPYNGIGENSGCTTENFTTIGNTAPANDECSNAILLTMSAGNCTPIAYSNTGATASNPGEFNCGQPSDRDIWFQLTSNVNSFNLTTGNLPAGTTAYDLFDACGGNNITCDFITSNNSYIITVPAGTYYLRISKPVGAPTGDIELCVWQSPLTPTLLSLTSTAATIKYHNPIDPATAIAANLKIWGDETGLRSGTFTVSNDTVTFQPITPFRAGEVIHITSKSSLLSTGGSATQPFSWMRPSAVSNPTAAVFDTTGTGIILPAAAYGANASYQATMADLNQDGLQDLIHRYISSGGASTNILVYLRNGNGTFAAPVTYNNAASYSILIGTPDLNNDGYPDIVLAHNVPSQIQVRLNNGAGGFGAAALYTVTNYCNGAKIYDLDNDGDLDIIAYAGNSSLSQNTISVLKNNGNGTFAAQVTTNTSVFGSSLLPVDLDNDGDGDLAYTSSGPFSSPKVFRVYRNDGTGALSLNNSETNNQEKVLSSAFDYNSDGNVDLISRTPNTDIYLSNSGISYSLASPTTFTTDHAQTFSGDLDGDGDLDIFNANSYNGSNWNTLPLKFFLNNGSASFSTTNTYLVLPGINVTDLSDYDGDGDLDHIYLKPNGEIGVLLNGNGAVQCPSGDLVFTTQSEIDAFPVSYPNCTQISGNVTISGAGISNLNGLSAITSIDGYLDISYNPDLTNMVGLDALSTIGGYLQVYSNAGLVRFTGLGALTDIADFLYVGANPDLSDFIGLEALTTIGGYLSIQDNALLGSMTGLEALTSIGAELFFEANPGLTNFNGLNALTAIGGELEILGNAGLTSLSGLEALTSIGSYLSIESNTALTGLTGLENINPATIAELYLLNSGELSLCNVPSICDYLAIPTNPATITGNATGCATRQEIEAACNPLPFCTSLTYPTSISTNIPVTAVLSWLVSAGATGYKLNVGTTFGGTEILNNFDVGNVTTYDPPGDFPYGTIIYVRITPYNGAGEVEECGLEQFTTVPNQSPPSCTGLTIPAPASTNVSIATNLSWSAVANATGYRLTIGTSPGGTEILNNLDVGDVTTYNPSIDFNYNTAIYITIVPYNNVGNAMGCAEQSFTTQQQSACGTLSGLTATIQSSSSVLVSWNPLSGVNAYQLRYRIVGTTTFTTMAATAATSQLINGLSPNTTYEYQLRVKCNGVWSGYNSLNQFTTPETSPVPACTSLTIPANNAINVAISTNLTWAASAGATGYLLTIGSTPGGTDLLNNFNTGNVTTYNPPVDFNFNTTIYVKIVPYNGTGNATGCTEQSFTTQQQSNCGTIAGLVAAIQSPTSVLISWNSMAGVNAYQLRYRITGTPTFTTLAATAATSQLITGLMSDTNYEYQLRVKCNGVWSGYNTLSNFITPEGSVIPACTSLINPVNGATNVMISSNISWAASAGATGYLLTIGTTPGGQEILNNADVGNTTTYNPAIDFNYNATIYVKVVPYSGAGNATGCTTQSFTTQQQSDCGTIGGLSAVIQSPTSVLISWNALAGVSAYQLRYRVVGTTTFTTLGGTVATSQLITGLISETNYEYQLRIKCNGVWSAYSGLSNFTTPEIVVIPACTSLTNPVNGAVNVVAGTNLTWSPSSGATGYLLTIGTTPGGNDLLNNLNVGNTTTYDPVVDFNFNTTFYVKVVPFNSAGNATGCVEQNFTTQHQSDCGTINGLSVTVESPTSVLISWNPMAGVSRYQLRYRQVGTTTFISPTATAATSLQITGLSPGNTYEYQLQVRCNGVWSGFNGLSSFTTTTNCTWYADFDNDGLGSEANGTITGTCSQPANYVSNNLDCDDNTNSAVCSLPAGNTVGNITSTAATISWTSSPCVTYYQVNYRVTGGAWSTPTSVVYGNSITYTGLTPGTTYQYRIRSKCDATSSTSAYVTGGFTTLTPPTGLIEDLSGDEAVSGSSMTDFDIYPNPGDGIFYLRLESESEQESVIQLTDMIGRLVLYMEWPLYKGENIKELDLTDYAKGIYQVHIQKGETTGCKKIVLIE